jgi:phage tail-like protein
MSFSRRTLLKASAASAVLGGIGAPHVARADNADQQGSIWPLPKFYFLVELGDGIDAKFSEVTGLEERAAVIEYRHGDSAVFSPTKRPGLVGIGNVTMRKGILARDSKFWEWLSKFTMNVVSRRTVVIKLLDETGAPKMVWTLRNAWPTKITGTDLKSEGNEVAVEWLELAFETLEVKAG